MVSVSVRVRAMVRVRVGRLILEGKHLNNCARDSHPAPTLRPSAPHTIRSSHAWLHPQSHPKHSLTYWIAAHMPCRALG